MRFHHLLAAAAVAVTTLPSLATADISKENNDIDVLNFALTLEHLGANFFSTFAGAFNASAYTAAGYSSDVYNNVQMVAQFEQAHVNALTSAIQQLGGSPVPACSSYNYGGIFSLESFLATARIIQNNDVSAYDGTVSYLSSTSLQQTAATIATVEGRFASYFNNLVNEVPFPNTEDIAYTPYQTLSNANAFLTKCGTTALAATVAVSLSDIYSLHAFT